MDQIRGLILVVFFTVFLAAAPFGASAEDSSGPGTTPEKSDKSAETAEPSVEDLLDRLSQSASEDEAKALERKIVAAWNASGSDTVDLLVQRAGAAIEDKDLGIALQYLDLVTQMLPDYAEGWNMRATVYYLLDEYELSLADIQRTLALQPRHFGALTGLGLIFRELDEPEKALEAYRQVLAVHPYFGKARQSVEKLETEVEGRDI
ncbi:tetratricopeptide repeat protein [Microbaculum marinisediminis]|uniref:Tetratricopeptide repeat protein n=1 Tax=Microbaculum marinisediminis TaxID=2931392 RepID=A0AAW5QVX7_9HYPH|nr:tetratricopeptide repeat protein [Microbaculum sp. A6E488]MCT8971664.1 tetratricopeptide repeat protein [Microbaculum sp. A6E488]